MKRTAESKLVAVTNKLTTNNDLSTITTLDDILDEDTNSMTMLSGSNNKKRSWKGSGKGNNNKNKNRGNNNQHKNNGGNNDDWLSSNLGYDKVGIYEESPPDYGEWVSNGDGWGGADWIEKQCPCVYIDDPEYVKDEEMIQWSAPAASWSDSSWTWTGSAWIWGSSSTSSWAAPAWNDHSWSASSSWSSPSWNVQTWDTPSWSDTPSWGSPWWGSSRKRRTRRLASKSSGGGGKNRASRSRDDEDDDGYSGGSGDSDDKEVLSSTWESTEKIGKIKVCTCMPTVSESTVLNCVPLLSL